MSQEHDEIEVSTPAYYEELSHPSVFLTQIRERELQLEALLRRCERELSERLETRCDTMRHALAVGEMALLISAVRCGTVMQ